MDFSEWDAFRERFVEWEFTVDPDFAVYQGRHDFDGVFPDLSPSGMVAQLATFRAMRDTAASFSDADLDARTDAPEPDTMAAIVYTSGTTGRPKGAMLTHGNLLWNNVSAAFALSSNPDDITLVAAPLFHIGGLNVTTLLAMQVGACVVLHRAFDPGKALEDIARRQFRAQRERGFVKERVLLEFWLFTQS